MISLETAIRRARRELQALFPLFPPLKKSEPTIIGGYDYAWVMARRQYIRHLRVVEGLTFKQIAQRLGISEMRASQLGRGIKRHGKT